MHANGLFYLLAPTPPTLKSGPFWGLFILAVSAEPARFDGLLLEEFDDGRDPPPAFDDPPCCGAGTVIGETGMAAETGAPARPVDGVP